VLLDLRRERDWPRLQERILVDGLARLGKRYAQVILDFADGAQFAFAPGHRWRWWRAARDART
jgi:hypothetical protein